MNKRQEQAKETRKRLLAVALDRFAQNGYAATSTRSIARAAGVSEGLIFHHFPRKIDLLMGIAKQQHTLASEVQILLRDGADVPVHTLVSGIGEAFLVRLSPTQKTAKVFRLLLAESRVSAELRAVFDQVSGQTISALADYLAFRRTQGELRDDLDALAAARALLGGLLWILLTNHAEDDERWRAEAAPLAAQQLQHWLQGVR